MIKLALSRRMCREARTVEVMVHRYCRLHHRTDRALCQDCEALLAYAKRRLRQCPFQDAKPTCNKCRIHCYAPAMRQRIRDVMRTIGPRLLFTNPILAIRHLVDGLRKPP